MAGGLLAKQNKGLFLGQVILAGGQGDARWVFVVVVWFFHAECLASTDQAPH